jgi:D-sedoheptulose 7-phosphate isomerase
MKIEANSFYEYGKNISLAFSLIDEEPINLLTAEFEKRINGNGSVYILGNGGSAANAHHITGDYMKTFALKRQRLRIECLSDNNCYITAASNDLDFSEIYEVLVGTRIQREDLLVLLSGSGNSMNLVKAARAARSKKVTVASITAFSGGALHNLSQISIHVPIADMEIAEDFQMIIMHHVKQRLCHFVDSLAPSDSELQMPKYAKRISEGLVS